MGSRGEDTRGLKGQDSKAYVSDSGFATGKRHIQALAAFLAWAAFRISTAIHDDLSGRRHALRKQVAHAPFALSLADLHSIYMENGACGLHQSRSKRAYPEGACPWQEHLATRRASNRKNYADSAFPADCTLSLVQPVVRQRYERNPALLTGELEALAEDQQTRVRVWIDEVQKVPALLDGIQDLIDRQIAQFILTGSSARKLRVGPAANWLPGRVVALRLDPLMWSELSEIRMTLGDLLLYGSLPGIVAVSQPEDKETDLASYVTGYLEEEIRSEALVRNVGQFARFLSLAASESGQIVNLRKLSQEIGVAHTTIAAYYQILGDCLIAERIEALTTGKLRRRLTKAPKYLFFDLGIRRLSAREGRQLPESYWGRLFEQWVGLELIRALRASNSPGKLYYWRDSNGPELDWVLERQGAYIPIEVKWTEKPRLQDAKYLALFKREYPKTERAYLVCRTPTKVKLAEGIYACPWENLMTLMDS